jgi:hypothetical protein
MGITFNMFAGHLDDEMLTSIVLGFGEGFKCWLTRGGQQTLVSTMAGIDDILKTHV